MKDYSLRDEKSRLIQATATSLHEHITELFDNGYDQGYADATIDLAHEENDRAYQQGLENAWKAAKWLYHNPVNLVEDIFNCDNWEIYSKYTIQEAISKIKEYEEQHQKFAVGDEVYSDAFDNKGIITHITADKVSCVCIICNGSTMMKVGTNDLHKTGRTFPQIAEVLNEMRGDKE